VGISNVDTSKHGHLNYVRPAITRQTNRQLLACRNIPRSGLRWPYRADLRPTDTSSREPCRLLYVLCERTKRHH